MDLNNILKQRTFAIGPYSFISQDPSVISQADRKALADNYLLTFLQVWRDIEKVTGYRWKCTSLIRLSPTHKKGQAIDLAPEFTPESERLYAVSKGSDPVLYKRGVLIKHLQQLAHKSYNPKYDLGIFIEPDHLHIQVLSKSSGNCPTSIIKYKLPKPVYGDTFERLKLGMLN